MERLQQRFQAAANALKAFKKLVMIENPDDIERDAAIQRFELTFEACWKAAKDYLFIVEGLDCGSPKSVIRSSREVGLFNEDEAIAALSMVDDRNLTVPTYNEEVAIKI